MDKTRPTDAQILALHNRLFPTAILIGADLSNVRRFAEEVLAGWGAQTAAPADVPVVRVGEQAAVGLIWSEPATPNEQIRYDHVVADSPLGRFSVEWKSWKKYDSRALCLDGEHLGSFATLDDAKAAAAEHMAGMAEKLRPFRAAASNPSQSTGDSVRVQWWLAELDQYGNPTLTDGAHSGRAGADKAAYLIAAMNLDPGRRFAVARVELSEPRPSAKGVNQEAIALHNQAALAQQAAPAAGGQHDAQP